MEDKKTTELLDLLQNLDEDDFETDGKYEKIIEVLKEREPFTWLLSENWDNSLPNLVEQVEVLREEIKKLKRHKHDDKSNDILIRI